MLSPLLRQLLVLGMARKTAAPNATLFNDSFDVDGSISAGVRTASPGPGTATITDSAAVWTAITANKLIPAKTTEVVNEPRYMGGPFTYSPGRAMIANIAWSSLGGSVDKTISVGFLQSATDGENSAGCYWQDSIKFLDYSTAMDMGVPMPSAGAYTQVAIVLQPDVTNPFDSSYYQFYGYTQNGGFYLFINKKLRYVSLWGWPITFVDLYAAVRNSWSAGAPRDPSAIDYIRVRDLGAPFNDGSFATTDERPPAWDTPYAADADGYYQFIFSTESFDPVGEPELRFRIQDANNYWRAFVDVATGRYCLESVAAGVATRRITGVNYMWYPGYYWCGFRISTEGTTIKLFSQSYGYQLYEGSVTLDHCAAATGVQIGQSDIDFTPQSLVCFPLSSPAYDVFDEV